ncbi:hypothetical protein ACKI2N_012475 [Cupriavidus sp. 30B13]|uniref:hypothetical protein n=1 Tax=Cupriavidus sp. 30B13 TaxID=3384241 RepID=UPI003B90DCF9
MKRSQPTPQRTVALSTLLPAEASAMLAAAATIYPNDPFARQKAVDAAIKRVKTQYPTYFRQE